jgi:hypothetical protein
MLIPDHAHIVRIGVEHAFIFFATQDISAATVAKKHRCGDAANDAAFRPLADPSSLSGKKIDHRECSLPFFVFGNDAQMPPINTPFHVRSFFVLCVYKFLMPVILYHKHFNKNPPTWSEDFCLFLLVLLRLFLVALLGVVAFGHMVIK